ncbi:MAG: bifunctional 4-hydroxy-2-oxoglutarate aldolase/2-dehydro-3-deoxy-phosphogluconate aldolase [Armatimonadota bacterium]
MEKQQVINAVIECGIVAVVRAESEELALKAVEAALAGGVNAIEVTFTVPGTLDVIRTLASKTGKDVILGAGTVLDPKMAINAIEAGARFIVSPNTNVSTIEAAKSKGVAVFPGALTPSEVVTARQAGGDIIKIFPANIVGPSYFKDLHGPFPDIPLMPTGGVDLSTARTWLEHGAVALGVGGALIDRKLMKEGNFSEITERARKFREIVIQFRTNR